MSHVGAGNHQQKENRTHKNSERGSNRADKVLGKRDDAKSKNGRIDKAGVFLPISLVERIEIGLRLFKSDAGFQPTGVNEEARAAADLYRSHDVRVEHAGDVDLWFGIRIVQPETRRQNADDRGLESFDADRLVDDVWIRIQAASPERVNDHRHWRGAFGVVFGRETSAQ